MQNYKTKALENTPEPVQKISGAEQIQIEQKIREDFVDHLYKGTPTGIISGFIASIGLFAIFYNSAKFTPLIIWFVAFNLMLVFFLLINSYHKKYRSKLETKQWEYLYGGSMMVCAALWGSTIFLIPDSITGQYLLMAFLLVIASSYTMGTIGLFRLCIVTICLILIPLIVWGFSRGTIHYNFVSSFAIFYLIFLFGINQRSTIWLKDSMRLKTENIFFTYQANHDLLTGLPNQRLLLQQIENCIKTARSNDHHFAVIGFSINRVEMINNTLGYEAGDLLILSLTRRFKTLNKEMLIQFGISDFIVTLPRRDAFIILVMPIRNEVVESICHKLLNLLNEPFFVGKTDITLTASIGISMYPNDGDLSKTLITNAYTAISLAKQRGGNQIEYYKFDDYAKTPVLLKLENELYHAVKFKEFILHYQPVYDAETNSISSVEALVRWKHPTRGLVYPIEFIPLAEETGLIMEIGEWVLLEACNQAVKWHRMGFKNLGISVNVAPRQLRHKSILTTVDKALTTSEIDPKFLTLELTETAILDETVAPLVKIFKDKGLSISIDDFGTGYSGFSYLKLFDVDVIKIDKSFIQDVNNNNQSAAIVSATLAMAKELNIKTLAEGVETKEQLEFLIKKGCHYIQGYYFSKPISAPELTIYLNNKIQPNQNVSHG